MNVPLLSSVMTKFVAVRRSAVSPGFVQLGCDVLVKIEGDSDVFSDVLHEVWNTIRATIAERRIVFFIPNLHLIGFSSILLLAESRFRGPCLEAFGRFRGGK